MADRIRFKDLAPFTAADMANASGFARKLNQVVETLQLIIGTRGPGKGNQAWFQSLVDNGLLDDGGHVVPRPPGSTDNTPPPQPTGLAVTPLINHLLVEWDAATYAQGGGNAYTTIYGTTYDPVAGGPLPTFAAAQPLATVPFSTQVYPLPTEPNVQWHIWITFTTYADREGLPAGGTNGVQATSGKLEGAQHIEALTVTRALIAFLAIDDARIASMSAAKIIAGAIAVGEYIESSGFVSGVQGFRVSGNGNAEFNNAVFRGVIEALSGILGGILIDASGIESPDYTPGTAGFRIDSDDGIDVQAGRIGGLDLVDGRLISRSGGFMSVQGAPFGSGNQFIDWYGPDLADLADCTEANAISYRTNTGDAYFGGTLAAGVLKNSAQATSLSSTSEVEVGPFLTNGDPKAIVLSYAYAWSISCDHGTGSTSGTGSATVVLERAFGAGSWTTIGTLTVPATAGTVSVDPDPGAPDTVYFNMGGSITVTDTSGAAPDMKLRGRITARTLPTVSGANSTTLLLRQTVGVISTEG